MQGTLPVGLKSGDFTILEVTPTSVKVKCACKAVFELAPPAAHMRFKHDLFNRCGDHEKGVWDSKS